MEEGVGWLKERNGGMAKEGGFPLRDRLRLCIALRLGVSFSSTSYSFYRPKVAYFSH